MLASLKEVCDIAKQRGIAVGSFNTPNLECLLAVLEAAEELDRFIDMLSAAPRTSSWDEEIEKTESKVNELPAEIKFLLKKLGVLEKMSAEAKELRREEAERLARIAAEEERKRREEEERREEQKRREKEARRIEAEKRKAEEERAEREKAEEYNREVLTLHGAEKTIDWALRVQEVWNALNGKLSAYYVSNRYLLKDMISDAKAMINATDLDWEIEKLESGQKTLEWANNVSSLYYKIENGMTYSEVCKIIGGEGSLGSSVDMGIGSEYETEIYEWKGNGSVGANANVTFQGGKVVGKAQAGLR